ncbi:1259_t:CDS:2 [Cetraspora pellucida]|uniref:1259_t:CDS:1 n=1 Tax=Cetraspora pellucida TaxID=1433469 RepID=A0ACA9P8Q9_9GLOM|nr:1259_t:CDS:2 [Cetraspora pellucida]
MLLKLKPKQLQPSTQSSTTQAIKLPQTQKNSESQSVIEEPNLETSYNQLYEESLNSDNDIDFESVSNINNLYKRKNTFVTNQSKKLKLDKRNYLYNEEAIIGSLESLYTIVNVLTDTINEIKKEQNEMYEFIKQQKTFTNQKIVRKAIHDKMDNIKYLSNELLEVVSKLALETHNKEIAWEYRSEIKGKVKKALSEVFGKDRFPPIEQACPSADQVNAWKCKDTIRLCFEDLENPKDPNNPGFTWRLAVLEHLYPEEITKNNIAFASVCIDVICNTEYSGYELRQDYVIQEMNYALQGIESNELEAYESDANYLEEDE